MSLNPYCNGIWTSTAACVRDGINCAVGLNPYCNGIWTSTQNGRACNPRYQCLNPYCNVSHP